MNDRSNPIELEIVEEKAGTLARVAERLEASLRALEAIEQRLAGAPGDGAALALREELLGEAAEWLWFLVVQREVVGATSHDALFEVYRIPAAVRRRMGPRRRPGG